MPDQEGRGQAGPRGREGGQDRAQPQLGLPQAQGGGGGETQVLLTGGQQILEGCSTNSVVIHKLIQYFLKVLKVTLLLPLFLHQAQTVGDGASSYKIDYVAA